MATETRNLAHAISLEELRNGIRNEENAGFLLREMSITIGKEVNQLVVEEGPPPASQIEVQELTGARTEAEATAAARKLHEDLPVDAGVVADAQPAAPAKKGRPRKERARPAPAPPVVETPTKPEPEPKKKPKEDEFIVDF